MSNRGNSYNHINIGGTNNRVHLGNSYSKEDLVGVDIWLSPLEPWSKHEQALNSCAQGTLEYFFEDETYEQWTNGNSKTLWCVGDMGAGKTILMAAITEDLVTQFQGSRTDCVAFFYFQNARRHEQTEAAVLGCLLRQLYERHGDESGIPGYVQTARNANGKRPPTLQQLRTWLKSEMERWHKVTIVLDGLDEVEQSRRCSLLDTLLNHDQSGRIQLLAASRRLPDIEEALAFPATIRVQPTEASLCRLISHRFEQPIGQRFCRNIGSKLGSPDKLLALKHQIEQEILRISNGM
jgi:hypothetical protein